MAGKVWNEEEYKKLNECIAKKLQWHEFVEIIGRSRTSIQTHMSRNGISYRPPFIPKAAPKTDFYMPPPREKLDPLHEARIYLAGRLILKDGCYRIDGTPKNVTEVMQETNRVLMRRGEQQITYNPAWAV